MPTRWGMFRALGFERDILNGVHRVETAVALVLGDVTAGVPLVRIHSQCFTGEMLGSLRCDCRDQLEMAMQAIAEEGPRYADLRTSGGPWHRPVGEVAGSRAAGRRSGYG